LSGLKDSFFFMAWFLVKYRLCFMAYYSVKPRDFTCCFHHPHHQTSNRVHVSVYKLERHPRNMYY